MSEEDEYKKKKPQTLKTNYQEDDDSQTGGEEGGQTGGQSGQIEFRDFIGTGGETRDDLLSYDEKRRLISAHQNSNEAKVKQQKEKRDEYNKLREGKTNLKAFREGLGHGIQSQFKANPALANKAQFSGVDRKVSTLPTENLAETNEDKRNELANELKYQPSPKYQPTFNPKPRGPGY